MGLYSFVKSFVTLFLRALYKFEIEGLENVPKEGSCVACSNHFHLLDPVIVGASLPRRVNYMAKEELFSNAAFGAILKKLGVFPVKRGGADISAIKTALKLLKGDEVLGIFPEGTRSKTGDMQEAKPGVAMIAIKSQSLVIPIAIISKYKLFKPIKVKIAPPIDLSQYYQEKLSTEEYQKISQEILDKIDKLMKVQ